MEHDPETFTFVTSFSLCKLYSIYMQNFTTKSQCKNQSHDPNISNGTICLTITLYGDKAQSFMNLYQKSSLSSVL